VLESLKDYSLSFFVCTPDAVCIQARKLNSIAPDRGRFRKRIAEYAKRMHVLETNGLE
jgi:hypothetical protein